MPRETTQEKSARLILNHAVEFDYLLPGEGQATVRGDHDTYTVMFDERGTYTCSCFTGRHQCSHISAVREFVRGTEKAVNRLLAEAIKIAKGD
jgi:hypothetical protein